MVGRAFRRAQSMASRCSSLSSSRIPIAQMCEPKESVLLSPANWCAAPDLELDNYSRKELRLARHLRLNKTTNGCPDGSNFLLLRSAWLMYQLWHVGSDQPQSTRRTLLHRSHWRNKQDSLWNRIRLCPLTPEPRYPALRALLCRQLPPLLAAKNTITMDCQEVLLLGS